MSMSIATYILKSETGKYYVGSTVDLDIRLSRHLKHTATITTKKGSWQLFMYRNCASIQEARELEKKLKSYKGGQAFKKIIHGEVAEWSKAPHC